MAAAVAAVTASAGGWKLDVGDNFARVWSSPPPVLQRLFTQLFDDRPEDVLSWLHSTVWELHKEDYRHGATSPRKVSFRAAGALVPKASSKDSDLELLDQPEDKEHKLNVQIPPRQPVRAAAAVSHWASGVDPDLPHPEERDHTPVEVESPIFARRPSPWARPEVTDTPTKMSPRDSRRRTSISSANSPCNPERGHSDSLAMASPFAPAVRGNRASVSSAHTEFLSLGRWSRICTNQLSDVLDMLTDGHPRREPESWWTRLKEDRMLQVSLLDMFMGAAVVLNAATIGLSTDWHREWEGWLVIDGVFATLFVMEIVVMLMLSGARKFFCGPDRRWHIFETGIATLAVVEIALALRLGTVSIPQGGEDAFTNMAPLFRIIRLCRVVRVVRLVRLTVFADLMMLIEGAVGGWKTLLWSIMIIMFPLYAVALVLRETLGEESGSASDSFSNIGASFFTVFRCVVSGECTQKDGRPIFLLVANSYGWGYAVLYCVIMLLMTFGLFNIIIAIYVENTVAAAKFNELHQKQLRLQDRKLVRMKLQELMELVWKKCGKTIPIEKDKQFIKEAAKIEIDPEFFQELRDDRRFREIMRDLDIADEDQLDLFDTLDVDGSGTIDFEELFIGISKLRGDARRAEIVSIGLLARSLQLSFHQFDRNTTQLLRAHSRALEDLKAAAGTPRPSSLADVRPSLPTSEALHQRDEVGMGTPRTTATAQFRPSLAATFDAALQQHREEAAKVPSTEKRRSFNASLAEPVVEC